MFVSFDGLTLIVRKILERKAFPTKPRHQYRAPNEEKVIVVPDHEKVEIIIRIQVRLI